VIVPGYDIVLPGEGPGIYYRFEEDSFLHRDLPGCDDLRILSITSRDETVPTSAGIFAGCEFFGGYPITPSTEIMHYLGREIWKYGGVVFQAEDEIAGVGAVVGASFAGKKAMTATSGPGMSLKTEMLGLATIAELPLVCVNVQRGGPSTGIPTKSEQSDLFQAAFSAHGDVVRPILAPTTVADTFPITVEAFNIAEEYQTPVIVLSDGDIAQRKEIVDPIDTSAVKIVQSWVTAENINETISKNGMEGEIDLLSVDIDGNDYWVWKAIDCISPRVAVIEYNASLGHEPITVGYDPNFDRYEKHPSGFYHGASLAAVDKLAKTKGYVLVGCDSAGVNAFFVRRDVAQDSLPQVSPEEAYFPHSKRVQTRTTEEQLDLIKHLAFDRV